MPGAVLHRPLSQVRLAAITSAGLYLPTQEAFDESTRGGDSSYRLIPGDADVETLRIGHRSDAFDPRGIEADRNLAMPLDRLREMEGAGVIGSVAPWHVSVMGSITAPDRLISTTGPGIAAVLRSGGVEAVLLTPV